MKTRLPIALSIMLLSCGAASFAEAPLAPAATEAPLPSQPEVRRHRRAKSASGQDDYSITEINRRIGPTDETLLLVEDVDGDRFLLTYQRNDAKRFKSYEIRPLGGEEFLRIELSTSPLRPIPPAPNRAAPAHQPKREEETSFEYTTAGNGRVSGLMSHWRDPETAGEWRSRLRSMLAPQFLEQLEIMQAYGFLQAAALNFAAFLVDDILYRNQCAVPELPVTDALPDCKFDQQFGFACSDAQKLRVQDARTAKPPRLGAY